MKALVYISVITTLILTACTTTRTGSVATDDIYYTPGDQVVIVEETRSSRTSDLDYRSNDHSRSDRYTDGQGNTYITNNYYDDYYYTSRLRRYYRPYVGFNYYSGIYTDYYWYTRNPSYYGVSIYIGSGMPYHPYHNYYGYHHYNPYYSYYPYGHYGHFGGYGSAYHHGYHHGYNHGFYNGYYGSPYNNNYGGYYGGGEVNRGNTNRYYGPRNTVSTNTSSGNRTSNVSYGKTDNTGGTGGKGISGEQVERADTDTRTENKNKTIQNTGTVSDVRTSDTKDRSTISNTKAGQVSANEGRNTVSNDRNTNASTVSDGRAIVEDRPRTYQSERNKSIYAPQPTQEERSVNTPSNDRYIQNSTDRSGYDRERYNPATERNRTPVQTERRNDNTIYQPRINTDTRDNRGYTPNRTTQPRERIYTPRQQETAPTRQSAPSREAAPQRRIEKRSAPAPSPQREYTPTPAPSNDRGGSNAAPSRGSSNERSSGRRGK